MKLSRTVSLGVAIVMVAGAAVSLAQMSRAAPVDQSANVADAAGNSHVPTDYRTLYQALGSWAIAADSGQSSKQMHTVYASPGTIDAYRKTGHFPDGAVLVKEVFATSTNEMTPGTVSHVDKLKGWFVMVKTAKDRTQATRCGETVGLVVVRCRQAPQDHLDKLPHRLPGLPRASKEH
ncbi:MULTISPECIES: cytochrome P460 family protein [unclassified Mesorhizobium]|uniref:cytochrome P460 family protein n=1 Tax=unclassified Mesorhizobium TaxID=325217 RepID=UPI001CD10697|nr:MULTISPECIES: cytochrome P460 family protein [unclassified Mesorhizobium]MBZ9894555.1 cytochrome P460 family protein [Mesorhizobium sp. BR1-1-6]